MCMSAPRVNPKSGNFANSAAIARPFAPIRRPDLLAMRASAKAPP